MKTHKMRAVLVAKAKKPVFFSQMDRDVTDFDFALNYGESPPRENLII